MLNGARKWGNCQCGHDVLEYMKVIEDWPSCDLCDAPATELSYDRIEYQYSSGRLESSVVTKKHKRCNEHKVEARTERVDLGPFFEREETP